MEYPSNPMYRRSSGTSAPAQGTQLAVSTEGTTTPADADRAAPLSLAKPAAARRGDRLRQAPPAGFPERMVGQED